MSELQLVYITSLDLKLDPAIKVWKNRGIQHIKLGRSGLDVSRICLGCMGFGDKEAKKYWEKK